MATRDPQAAEAAKIMLWKLSKEKPLKGFESPASLKVFEAYLSGRPAHVLAYLQSNTSAHKFASHLLKNCISRLEPKDLAFVESLPRSASFTLQLAIHADRKLNQSAHAKKLTLEFFNDPWTARLVEEISVLGIEKSVERKLLHAYAQKDSKGIRKILESIKASSAQEQLQSSTSKGISPLWRASFLKAIQFDLDHVSENLVGFPFWKLSTLSSQAVDLMRKDLFSEEMEPIPTFIEIWQQFLTSDDLEAPSKELEPNQLSLWQIRVELDPECLSEALLRFPSEERFLILWAARKGTDTTERDPRSWPIEERESTAVRKNLERAFERAKNKNLWFSRIRQLGCSQDFYEFVLYRSPLPLEWVLEDLKKAVIQETPGIRRYLVDQLSLTDAAKTHSPESSGEFTVTQFLEALKFLTPVETQKVLLARYILKDLEDAIIRDEYLDLFWDARSEVSGEIFSRWTLAIVNALSKRPAQKMEERHWLWIRAAWSASPEIFERFQPRYGEISPFFPWEEFLETAESMNREDLLLNSLPLAPEDSMKEKWIHEMLATSDHPRLLQAIESLKTESIRYSLLALWYEKRGDFDQAITARTHEMECAPVLNDQVFIAKDLLRLYRKVTQTSRSKEERAFEIDRLSGFLEKSGCLDSALCLEVAEELLGLSALDQAWNWMAQGWSRASVREKEECFEKLLDLSFRSRTIDEARRLLVDFIFNEGSPAKLSYEILNTLLAPQSVFKLKHLRREFVERAGFIFPLHRELLRTRAQFDYRAVLLWEAFYGEDLEIKVEPTSISGKRKFELWNLTESVTHADSLNPFVHYLNLTDYRPVDSRKHPEDHEFLGKAQRLTHRLAKNYRIGKAVDVELSKDLKTPIRVSFNPAIIEVHPDFFDHLDEESWSALSVGVFQLLHDRERGLFDEKFLLERFFQGMLLSGAPVGNLIRLWVWLAIHEKILEPQVLQLEPEALLQRVPLLNQLLIFYLSVDFQRKVEECSLSLS